MYNTSRVDQTVVSIVYYKVSMGIHVAYIGDKYIIREYSKSAHYCMSV